MNSLNLKQRLFVEKYIQTGGNATRAYAIAYGQSNYNIAGVCGHKMLRLAKIQAFLEEIRAQAGVSDADIALALRKKIDLGSYKSIELAFKMFGYKNI